jgi:hypothetical protein
MKGVNVNMLVAGRRQQGGQHGSVLKKVNMLGVEKREICKGCWVWSTCQGWKDAGV